MRRGLVAVLAAIAVVSGALVAAPAQATPAQAAAFNPVVALQSFDPGNIISDEVMFNPNTMSQAAIQSFLNAQVPTCVTGYTCLKSYTQSTYTIAADPMCAQYTGAANETSAAIIYKVAKACGVNPQALLVTLQKEQSLVTDDWPGDSQYRKATGYACPDSSSTCDSVYNGFFNQVYRAAWAFKRYTTPVGTTGPGWTTYNWFPVGRPSGILYSPSTSCGSATVTIENKATASLYYYTPYTPNAGALAAGFGTAACGAYGNRNFYLYFTEWFGSTHYTVSGVIGTLWNSLGAGRGVLGNATGNATALTANGGGTTQTFQHGAVYSSAAGTFAVTGAMSTEYSGGGGPAGALGWPRKAVAVSKAGGGGSVQGFQFGAIYTSKTGTFAVAGAIHTAYAAAGSQGGALLWPTTDAVTSASNGGGSSQGFTGGVVLGATGRSAIAMKNGTFLTEYIRRGGRSSTLGWPTSGVQTVTAHGGGTQELFQNGGLYRSKAGQFGVLGSLAVEYARHGTSAGVLGWPTAVARTFTTAGGGASQTFMGGTIYWSATAGAHTVGGSILKEYVRRGAQGSTMGWPIAGGVHVTAHGGGTSQTFQSGRILTSKHGTWAVRGAILTAYMAVHGASGGLGWPIGGYHVVAGASTQAFQGGTITWTAAGGAVVHRHS